MPKPKPDQTIRHEISLSRPTQDLFSDAVVAYQINKVATPLVALVSDASAMLIIAGLLEAYGITDIIPNDIVQQIKDGVYEEIGPALSAIEFAVDLAPHKAGERTGKKIAASPVVKVWVWLLTSGRILTEQVTGGR